MTKPKMFVILAAMLCATASCRQGSDALDRSWGVYKADAHSSSFSPLEQINSANVSGLKPAWTFSPADMAPGARPSNSQCNPIIIDGVMYATSAKQLAYALDAATGKQLWSYDPFDGADKGSVYRGVTYWEDKSGDQRIFFTAGEYLIALDARSGKPVETFGTHGKVALNIGLRGQQESATVSASSPGIIYKDLIIMGCKVPDAYDSQPGYVRAYNAKTGKLAWTFHTIPQPGEPGYETWPKDAWKTAGGANAWTGMSLDEKRGMVFLALGSPTYDFYGADRKGDNLYGNCVLALDASTGKHKWHFQLVHHDLWDYDLPAPPNLVTIKRNGKDLDAVAQITKHGFIFVFDRQSGKPLFPIEERPVPASNMPGETAAPTQPFPVKPKPFARQWMTEADLTHFSPADHEAILKKFRSLRYEGLFTPPDLKGTLMLPGTRGGGEWGGGAYDPSSSTLYFKSNDAPDIQTIVKVQTGQDNSQTVYEQGKSLYTTYCASCHGADRKGHEPTYPSLRGLKERMSRAAVLEKINKGGGVMPGFASIIKGKEEAILAFVYELKKDDSKAAQPGIGQAGAVSERYLNTTGYTTFIDPSGNPALSPPWGTLHALDLSTGEYLWQIPLGDESRLRSESAPETGQESRSGPMVTAGGLIFISGTNDKKLRAFDKKTGKLLWATTLPGIANANPCTYQVKGKQYVAISVGGTTEAPAGFIMAFALP